MSGGMNGGGPFGSFFLFIELSVTLGRVDREFPEFSVEDETVESAQHKR